MKWLYKENAAEEGKDAAGGCTYSVPIVVHDVHMEEGERWRIRFEK